jgi:tetratricopeptide (TPR) repeat protein
MEYIDMKSEITIKEAKERIKELDKAIELDPTNAELYFKRGNIYRKELGYYETDAQKYAHGYAQSAEDYTKAIEYAPDFAEAYCARANSYIHFEPYEKALEISQRLNC